MDLFGFLHCFLLTLLLPTVTYCSSPYWTRPGPVASMSICSPSFIVGTCTCTILGNTIQGVSSDITIDLSDMVAQPLVANDTLNVWSYHIAFCARLDLPEFPACHKISSVCQTYGSRGYDVGRPENTRFEWQIKPGRDSDPLSPALVTDNGHNERTIAFLMCDPINNNNVSVTLTAEPWYAETDKFGFRLTFLHLTSSRFCPLYVKSDSKRISTLASSSFLFALAAIIISICRY